MAKTQTLGKIIEISFEVPNDTKKTAGQICSSFCVTNRVSVPCVRGPFALPKPKKTPMQNIKLRLSQKRKKAKAKGMTLAEVEKAKDLTVNEIDKLLRLPVVYSNLVRTASCAMSVSTHGRRSVQQEAA